MNMMNDCLFCDNPIADGQPTEILTQKGCDGILKASDARFSDIKIVPGQVVHVKCRSQFKNPRSIQSQHKHKLCDGDSQHLQLTLRSEESFFNYRSDSVLLVQMLRRQKGRA